MMRARLIASTVLATPHMALAAEGPAENTAQKAAAAAMMRCLALETSAGLDTCDAPAIVGERAAVRCDPTIARFTATFAGAAPSFTRSDFVTTVADTVVRVRAQSGICRPAREAQ